MLLIDVLNDLEWDGAEQMERYLPPMIDAIADLKKRAHEAGMAVIYVNDNYGKWKSDWNTLITHCLNDNVRGKEMVERLKPTEEEYFVLKPKHSGFFSTTLEVLLEHLQSRTLILTGIAGNICLLFTANDAYMRDIKLFVPSDCCASNEKTDNDYALHQMRDLLKADIRPSTELDLKQMLQDATETRQPNLSGASQQAQPAK